MISRREAPTTLPGSLLAEVADCGLFPGTVTQSLAAAVGQRPVLGHLVHREATFAGHEVLRHLTVLVLVEGALVICHADEAEVRQALVTTEVIRLSAISSVALSTTIGEADSARARLTEAWLTILWGTTSRLDLSPSRCSDPTCDADHGYQGETTADDYSVRMSHDADGSESLRKLTEFAGLLQGAVA